MANGLPLEEPFLAYNIRIAGGPEKIYWGHVTPSALCFVHLSHSSFPVVMGGGGGSRDTETVTASGDCLQTREKDLGVRNVSPSPKAPV